MAPPLHRGAISRARNVNKTQFWMQCATCWPINALDYTFVFPPYSEVNVSACKAGLGAPDCKTHELTLPKQVCKELVYGHAETKAPHPAHPKPAHPHA